VNLLKRAIRWLWTKVRQVPSRHNLTLRLGGLETHWSLDPDLLLSRKTVERLLTENILPFWYPQILDVEDGGYQLNHDLHGRWRGRANKSLVAQARTVWFFARLANSRYGRPEHLQAARHGYEFLRDRMWDQRFGGFYWEVNSPGNKATKSYKHLYGQAFALYALSEYARASEDFSVIELARKLFGFLESYAHDKQYGGYQEFFRRDWGPVPIYARNYLYAAPNIKLMNTHLHLMEGITTYYPLTEDSVARERLIELIFIQSNAVVRKRVGACTDKYQRDWTPLQGSDYDRVSYGHDIQNIWLLDEACQTAGISTGPLLDLYRTVCDYALQYGFDRKRGGFYDTGPLNKPADRRDKVWWVQAEGLVGTLHMYLLTHELVYLDSFLQTLDWIVKYQADWANGEWHRKIGENRGSKGDNYYLATGEKAGPWKGPYHTGRAALRCLELLSSIIKP
jgi:mannose/cellobiose epimerase-like protein (N-acyl-D-glucosamine 2-epimerase family)